jgi:hypothetical protein
MAFRNHRLSQIAPTTTRETVVCPNCDGWGTVDGEEIVAGSYHRNDFEYRKHACKPCNGHGVMVKITRVTHEPLRGPEPAHVLAPVPPDWSHPATYADPSMFPPPAPNMAPGSLQILAA